MWFQYSAGCQGEHPARQFKDWHGNLQAGAFAGYSQLYADGHIVEAACRRHVRCKLSDIHERRYKLAGTLLHQGLERSARIFDIEAQIRGRSALRRMRARQVHTEPILRESQAWMHETLTQVSAKSPMAQAIGHRVQELPAPVFGPRRRQRRRDLQAHRPGQAERDPPAALPALRAEAHRGTPHQPHR